MTRETTKRDHCLRPLCGRATLPRPPLPFSLLVTALAVLVVFQYTPMPVRGQQDCSYPLEIYVYESQDQCLNRETPSAVGQLYADGECRATQVLSQESSEATFLLPGRYSAVCIPDGGGSDSLGQVEFIESGCTTNTCSSSSGGDVCDRDTGTASFYSRLSTPRYNVQESPTSNFVCLQLRSDSSTFFFAIFGDCTSSACEATTDPTAPPVPATDAPSPAPSGVPTTDAPSDAPIPAPTPPAEETPAPAPAPAPTTDEPAAEPTAQPVTEEEPTPSPVSQTDPTPTSPGPPSNPQSPSTPSPDFPPSSEQNPSPSGPTTSSPSSNVDVGVLVGAVIGSMVALAMVLVAGFYAGSLRQQKKQQSSTGQNSPVGAGGGGGSGGGPDNDNNGATWIPATLAAGPGHYAQSKEIVVDPNYADDVSTLGTPWGVMSTGPGGATVVIEDGTVAQNSLAYDYKSKPEPSLAEDSNTFASGPTAILSGALAARRAGGAGGAARARTILADDSSFEKAYDDDEKDYDDDDDTELEQGTPLNTLSQGLRFTVTVPAGKLGMVIDNSPGTVPEVRALKPDSVLVSRGVLVGDYLEQVDGMDVRDWTCLQVSQMIQKKSAQKSRELVFFRKPRGSTSGGPVYTIDRLDERR